MQEVDGVLVAAQELKRPLLELRQLALGFNGDGKEDEKIRAEMVAVSERALRQVNDLAKIRSLELSEFPMEPVAVRMLCDDVIKEVSELFGKRKCEMKVRYANRSRLVVANAELLSSVIFNFILDALNYTDDDMKTELDVYESRGRVAIKVRDFGPALPMDTWQEIKGNLLKPKDIAMRPGSSALGLYIASKFSKYMHAEVGAVRHRDGASFFVKMPVSKQMTMWSV